MLKKFLLYWFMLTLLWPLHAISQELEILSDNDLSDVSGQSLFTTQFQTVAGQPGGGSLDFFKVGMDVEMQMNVNIKSMKLGCDGANGTGICDLDGTDISFGCVADAGGTCLTVGAGGVATQMKDFTLNRPFLEFAIKNPGTLAQRELVGVRIAANSSQGPLSFGSFNRFSGYLNATANMTMQGQTDVAVTCGPSTGPCKGGGNHATGVNAFGYNAPAKSMDLDNDRACFISICAEYRELTVDFGTITRPNLPVLLSGSRQTQAFISNIQLGAAIDTITNNMTVNQSSGMPAWLVNLILPLVAGQANTAIKGQLATALGTTTTALDNNTYVMPYNIANMHQVDILPTSSFGLSVQKQGVLYPGTVAAMPKGWGMYLPNAFVLTVSQPMTVFVSNISNGNAALGDIVLLPNSYKNCWGTLNFC